ncbi:MAG: hypothetical protein K6C41_07180 [Lachnospiraceae bacterium]|nr:hypothetical protein [Lachnospiraceae bacterium]
MKKRMVKVFSFVLVFVLSFSFCRTVSFAQYSGIDSYWDQFSSDYYYRNMNKAQKELYDRLYEECMEILTTEKDCTNYNDGYYFTDYIEYDKSLGTNYDDTIGETVFIFANSNPQFYFLMSESPDIRYPRYGWGSGYDDSYYVALDVYSDFRKGSDRKRYTEKFSSEIDKDLTKVKAGTTAYQKELIAHDIIANRLTYDANAKYDQSSASVFLTTSSVCAGYSEGLELLLNAAGFDCIPVTSESHEWIEVKLDGTWYAVDVTWDDEDDYFGTVSYDLFNVSDATLLSADRESRELRGSHTPESFYSRLNRPKCNYDYPEKDPNAKPDDPTPVDPDPVDPDPVDPDPVDPDPVDPDPVNPDPVDPDPVNPDPVNPKPDGTGIDDYGLTGTFTNEAGDTALFRVYNPNTWEHFYTTDVAERRSLILAGWKGEGIIGFFPTYASTDTDIMYRFRNPNTGDHHYTADMLEIVDIRIAGWIPEGTSFFSLRQGKGIPIYRLYNPNAVTGTHHYTSDKAERDHLVSIGWRDEGISWYASSK